MNREDEKLAPAKAYKLLAANEFNIRETAKQLGVRRETLIRHMKIFLGGPESGTRFPPHPVYGPYSDMVAKSHANRSRKMRETFRINAERRAIERTGDKPAPDGPIMNSAYERGKRIVEAMDANGGDIQATVAELGLKNNMLYPFVQAYIGDHHKYRDQIWKWSQMRKKAGKKR